MTKELTTIDHAARAHSSVERQVLNRKTESCSIAELRERITYDPDTGVVRWRTAFGARTRVGEIVGWKNSAGYLKFKIGTTPYFLSRAIWAYVHGYWPPFLIDHEDGDRTNNRLKNLRPASNRQNCQNKKKKRLGLKGATWNKAANSWAAQIGSRKNGRRVNNHLGLFDTEEEAHEAYRKAAAEMFGEYARFE